MSISITVVGGGDRVRWQPNEARFPFFFPCSLNYTTSVISLLSLLNIPGFNMSHLPYEDRISWFHQARFGLFIHWGLSVDLIRPSPSGHELIGSNLARIMGELLQRTVSTP